MANVWSGVTVDCLDPQRVARFWSTLLGREPGPSQDGWVYLGERGDPQPRLVFQPVSEPATGKVRIHLDVTVDDIEEAIATVIRLGGRETGTGPGLLGHCKPPRSSGTPGQPGIPAALASPASISFIRSTQ